MISFKYRFNSHKDPMELFSILMEPKNWWVGLFDEVIEGSTQAINQEFSFTAGGGIHQSHQILASLEEGEKIVWLVTKSNLSFLKYPDEWTGTRICFELEKKAGLTEIEFTHEGLIPQLECFEVCSEAWTKYLQLLEKKLN